MNEQGQANQSMFEVPVAGKTNDDVQQSLQRCLAISELPEMIGVARRVVTELNSRIGHSSLDFEEISRKLCFSRRTLQRRLSSQGYSFSELRDQVRRHHAVRMLLFRYAKVDEIYTALDFSDRTSLNLAFRRWTGMSPRGFIQLYREPVQARATHRRRSSSTRFQRSGGPEFRRTGVLAFRRAGGSAEAAYCPVRAPQPC